MLDIQNGMLSILGMGEIEVKNNIQKIKKQRVWKVLLNNLDMSHHTVLFFALFMKCSFLNQTLILKNIITIGILHMQIMDFCNPLVILLIFLLKIPLVHFKDLLVLLKNVFWVKILTNMLMIIT